MSAKTLNPKIPIDRADWEKGEFKSSFKKSFYIHVSIVAFTVLSSLIFPNKGKVLQSALRVDLVGLPDIKKSDLAKATASDLESLGKKITEAAKEAKTEPKEKIKEPSKPELDSMVLKKEAKTKTSSLKSAIDRIKTLQDLEESVGKEKPRGNSVVARGNKLSKGSSLIGDPADSYNEYADKMKARLTSNWDLPVWLAKQDLSAQVYLTLDKNGGVTNTVFTKSSGNKQFDGYVLRTIQLSQPFGPTPDEILDSGVTLGFPL